jgi:hypothetical protein
MKKTLVAGAAVLALALSACGGGGGRPSEDEIAKTMKDQISKLGGDSSMLTDDVVNCIAKKVHDSDLSDSTLNKMVDDKKGSSDETSKATQVIADATTSCIKA